MMPFRLSTVGLALVGLFTLPSPAQPPTERREPIPTLRAVGSEAFRGLLHYHKVEPVRPGEIAEPDYSDLIVVVFGNPRISSRNRVDPNPYTQRALRNGGAVLIAVDSQLTLTDFFPDQPDARITGDAVTCPDGIGAYAGFADCPIAVPRRPGEIVAATSDSEWGLFLGITQLATNKPSTLVMGSKSRFLRSELAGFPPKAHVRTALGQWSNPANRLFAAAGSSRRGESPFQCLVLSDPSVFSNQMMAPPEGKPPNHNVVFADRVVQWLRGPNGRSKCLFIENGVPQTQFDVVRYEAIQGMPPLPDIKPPDLLNPQLQQQLTDSLNEGISRLQDRDVINQKLAGDNHKFHDTTRFLAGVAAGVLFVLLAWRVWRGRHEPDVPPIPTDTGRVAGTAPPGSLARRREEILQTGDYGGVLREYLQQLFASRGLPEATVQPHKLPEVRVQGRGNTTLREDLRILWDVAFGPRPRPVSYTRWKELEPMIDAVRRAAAEGRWRFADTGDAA